MDRFVKILAICCFWLVCVTALALNIHGAQAPWKMEEVLGYVFFWVLSCSITLVLDLILDEFKERL